MYEESICFGLPVMETQTKWRLMARLTFYWSSVPFKSFLQKNRYIFELFNSHDIVILQEMPNIISNLDFLKPKMSSIILPVGQCGNQISHELMTLVDNHSLSHPMTHRDGKLRCVCVDSEPKVIGNALRSDKKHGNLLREKNMIVGQSGRGNNFALGYYGLGGETEEDSLLYRTMDVVRKEVERCDSFAGTIVMHSLTGGTGSGLGSHLVEALRDAYPLAHVMSVAVSPHLSGDSPLQNYNSLLSLAALQRNADCVVVFSNDDVLRHLIAHRGAVTSKQPSPSSSVSLKDMNQLIAASLAGVLLPLGQKPKKILRKSSTNKNKSISSSSRRTTSSVSVVTALSDDQRSTVTSNRKRSYLNQEQSRHRWSASSTLSNYSFVCDGSVLDEDDSESVMQRQPRATVSALLRYRGITSKSSGFPSHPDDTNLNQSTLRKSDSLSETVDVPTGNEPWEMLRSVCPEPSKKFATIHHMSKAKVTWEALTQSLLHSTCRYDKDGRQFLTLNSLLIARGTGEKPFSDSVSRAEERLKSSLGCVEWNPFPLDFWIIAHEKTHGYMDMTQAKKRMTCGLQMGKYYIPAEEVMTIQGQYSAAGSRDAQSLTLCLNSSRIMGFLDDVVTKARTMYDVGAYVHWFEKHGCTKDEFLDAFNTLDGVVEEYRCATL